MSDYTAMILRPLGVHFYGLGVFKRDFMSEISGKGEEKLQLKNSTVQYCKT